MCVHCTVYCVKWCEAVRLQGSLFFFCHRVTCPPSPGDLSVVYPHSLVVMEQPPSPPYPLKVICLYSKSVCIVSFYSKSVCIVLQSNFVCIVSLLFVRVGSLFV